MLQKFKLNKLMLALGIIGFFIFCADAPSNAEDIQCDDRSGRVGEEVVFPIWIDWAPNDVGSFGFSIVYDPSVLAYTAYYEHSVLTEFDFFGVNESAGGTLKIGGFCTDKIDQIWQGDGGSLVSMHFEVVGHDDCWVHIRGLKDDMEGWSARSGRFTGDHADDEEPEKDTSPDDSGEAAESDADGSAAPYNQTAGVLRAGKTETRQELMQKAPRQAGDIVVTKIPDAQGAVPENREKATGGGLQRTRQKLATARQSIRLMAKSASVAVERTPERWPARPPKAQARAQVGALAGSSQPATLRLKSKGVGADASKAPNEAPSHEGLAVSRQSQCIDKSGVPWTGWVAAMAVLTAVVCLFVAVRGIRK